MIRHMGLDLSLTSTGICIADDTSVITPKSRGAERLHAVSSHIMSLIYSNDINLVCLEGYSFASRNSQAHSIGELGGAVRMRLWEGGVPYIEIPPTSRAKFATGRGNAAKTEVMSAVSAKTGIVFSGSGADDMCDAWILYEMCNAFMGVSKYEWSLSSMTALDKVDWSPIGSLQSHNEGE